MPRYHGRMYVPYPLEFVATKREYNVPVRGVAPFDTISMPTGTILMVIAVDPYDDNACEVICQCGESVFKFDSADINPTNLAVATRKYEEDVPLIRDRVDVLKRRVAAAKIKRDLAALDRLLTEYGLPDKWRKYYGLD